ncbi:MAG: type II secretion system protein, partial [Minisyncoccia bacterium]
MNIRIQKGFTLLEILLVIAILGILALMILVAIRPNRQLSQVTNARRNADINTIYSALEQYFSDNLQYPAGLTTEKQDICNGSTVINNCVDLSSLVPIYLVAIPVDPSGEAYQIYINPGNNKIGIEAGNNELGQIIAINPISTSPTTTPTPTPGPTPTPTPGPTSTPTPGPTSTPEELIQAEIAAGTLVPTGTQQ